MYYTSVYVCVGYIFCDVLHICVSRCVGCIEVIMMSHSYFNELLPNVSLYI